MCVEDRGKEREGVREREREGREREKIPSLVFKLIVSITGDSSSQH